MRCLKEIRQSSGAPPPVYTVPKLSDTIAPLVRVFQDPGAGVQYFCNSLQLKPAWKIVFEVSGSGGNKLMLSAPGQASYIKRRYYLAFGLTHMYFPFVCP